MSSIISWQIERESFESFRTAISVPLPVYEHRRNDVSELASRVGLSKRRVKKHLTHKYFPTIKVSELKSTLTFSISGCQLFQIITRVRITNGVRF